MNLPLFLARNVALGGTESISRTIIGIAVAAVAISMATMVLASALISGFKSEISDKIFGFWGHIHITADAASYSIMETYNYPISNKQDFYPSLDTIGRTTVWDGGEVGLGRESPGEKITNGGVAHIQQFIVLPGVASVYKQGERWATQEALIMKGIGEDYDWERFSRYIVEGEPLVITPDSSSRGIVISTITANRLQIGVGDRIDFTYIDRNLRERPRALTVTGIYKTGMEEYDRKFALVDIKQPRALLGWKDEEVGGFEVMIDDLEDLEVLSNYIHYEVLPQELYAESIRRKMDELFKWLDIQDYNFIIILGLMIVVAIINMMTALLILILERTNMIGTLKALGQNNWSIRQIFLYYAGFIVISGLLLGNAIGLGLCRLQKTFEFIRLDEESYYLAVAPIRIDWITIAGLNAGTFLITLAFLIVPSYLVTRIDPVKAIRFK